MAITWDQSLSTGVPKIDTQHQELFRTVNALLSAMRSGKGKEEIGNILKFLAEYSVKHFTDEELEMEKAGCPAALANKIAHQQFVRKFEQLQRRFREEGCSSGLVLEVQKHLVNWVADHVRQVDTKLAAFAKNAH